MLRSKGVPALISTAIFAGTVIYVARDCRKATYDATRGAGQAIADLTHAQIEEWKDTVRKQFPKDSRDVVASAVDILHKGTRVIDEIGSELVPLTVAEENELGGILHERVLADHPILNDSAALQRVKSLAAPLLAHTERAGAHFRFVILDSDTANAFTHIGGYVYIHRGIIDRFAADEELQFVVGHEIGHNERKHVLQGLSYSATAYKVGGTFAQGFADFAYRNIAVGYSEENELDADLWSYDTMRKIGRTREERLAGPKRFVELFPTEAHRKPDSAIGQVGVELRNHYRTHPESERRLAVLQELSY